MSLKSLGNGVAAVALAAATLVPLATAEARDGYPSHGRGFGHHGAHRAGANPWAAGRQGWDGHGDYGRHERTNTGEAVAIGAFAVVLGLALAAHSRRVQEDYYDERD